METFFSESVEDLKKKSFTFAYYFILLHITEAEFDLMGKNITRYPGLPLFSSHEIPRLF